MSGLDGRSVWLIWMGEEMNAYRIVDVDWRVIPKWKLKKSDGMAWSRYPSSG